jgi:hypothetical protein
MILFGALLVVITGSARAEDQCIAAYSATTVAQFLQDLQQAVASDDRSTVAVMVSFPITITVAGKRVVLHNRSQLLKYYDLAFDTKVKGFIAKQRLSDLFCNWKGLMIGRGEVWLNTVDNSGKLKIIAIDNNPPWSP